jgi:hypothetical protein
MPIVSDGGVPDLGFGTTNRFDQLEEIGSLILPGSQEFWTPTIVDGMRSMCLGVHGPANVANSEADSRVVDYPLSLVVRKGVGPVDGSGADPVIVLMDPVIQKDLPVLGH